MNVLRVDKNVGLMQKQGGILLYWVRTEIIFAKISLTQALLPVIQLLLRDKHLSLFAAVIALVSPSRRQVFYGCVPQPIYRAQLC